MDSIKPAEIFDDLQKESPPHHCETQMNEILATIGGIGDKSNVTRDSYTILNNFTANSSMIKPQKASIGLSKLGSLDNTTITEESMHIPTLPSPNFNKATYTKKTIQVLDSTPHFAT